MPDPTTITLHWVDILIIFVFLAAMILVGIYHSRKQDSLMQFFLARRGMTWIPVGISLMAALNSGMDYLNTPSVVINYGWLIVLVSLSWLVIYPYVFFIILPMLRRLDVMSLYEFIGLRFGERAYTLTSVIFLFWRLSWMAMALYVPCLAITTAIGRADLLIPLIIILGAVVTFYTMMGGIKTVIWNNVAQFGIMMAGLVIVLTIVLNRVEGGVSAIFANFFNPGIGNFPNPSIETTTFFGKVWSYLSIPLVLPAFILGFFVRMVGFTSDQVMTQRFGTAKSISHARRSFLITAISDSIWMTTLFFIGLALATYLKAGGIMPQWVMENPDRILPRFMAEVFPVGLTGFVLAAILAASLSSIDSAINSITTVCIVDFYRRLILGRSRKDAPETAEEQHRQVKISRIVTVAVGALGITLSCNVKNIGTLFYISGKLIGTFIGPMLAIFWLGMFAKRSNSFSVILGSIVGVTTAALLSFFSPISPQWIAPIGLALTLLVGYFFGSSKYTEKAKRWNWFSIVKTELKT